MRGADGGETWRDESSKPPLVWYPALAEPMKQSNAVAACKKLGLRLPTKEEYQAADKNGIRDILGAVEGFQDCWSSSGYSSSYDAS